jgi:Phosphotransferase enzyme family
MMFSHLCDPDLPAMQTLVQADLDRITGTPGTRLLRARYQPGARAVLHVDLGAGQEGSVWFFAGTKAQGLARRLPDARLDAASGALFQTFPQDHRMPHLATFVSNVDNFCPRLIGGEIAGPPQLMRYRPGLSATFRVRRQDGCVFYVKQTPGEDVQAQARAMTEMSAAIAGSNLGVAEVAGVIPDLGLIAYAAAPGRPLDLILSGAAPSAVTSAMVQVSKSLQTLWSLSVHPARTLDKSALLARAEQASQMIALLDPPVGRVAAAMVDRLRTSAVQMRAMPIHADMKLEHAFLSGTGTTLIDIESLSLGDPNYDLAKLEARLSMAELAGMITPAEVAVATKVLHALAGPHYSWFVACARLQCAKFFAQRFDPATIPMMRSILERS